MTKRVKREIVMVRAGGNCDYCASMEGHKHEIREDGYINVRAEPISDRNFSKDGKLLNRPAPPNIITNIEKGVGEIYGKLSDVRNFLRW